MSRNLSKFFIGINGPKEDIAFFQYAMTRPIFLRTPGSYDPVPNLYFFNKEKDKLFENNYSLYFGSCFTKYENPYGRYFEKNSLTGNLCGFFSDQYLENEAEVINEYLESCRNISKRCPSSSVFFVSILGDTSSIHIIDSKSEENIIIKSDRFTKSIDFITSSVRQHKNNPEFKRFSSKESLVDNLKSGAGVGSLTPIDIFCSSPLFEHEFKSPAFDHKGEVLSVPAYSFKKEAVQEILKICSTDYEIASILGHKNGLMGNGDHFAYIAPYFICKNSADQAKGLDNIINSLDTRCLHLDNRTYDLMIASMSDELINLNGTVKFRLQELVVNNDSENPAHPLYFEKYIDVFGFEKSLNIAENDDYLKSIYLRKLMEFTLQGDNSQLPPTSAKTVGGGLRKTK